MSRLLTLLIALALASPALAQDRPKVVTTFTVLADMARNVAGEAAEVESLTKPGAEIHYYQPTPGDIRRAQGADLILWNGLNLEQWFERFLNNRREELIAYKDDETWREAGQGGFEIRTYIALAGSVEGCTGELWFYAPIPIFAVGCTIAVMHVNGQSRPL